MMHQRYQDMVDGAVQALVKATLRTTFQLSSQKARTAVEDLVGSIVRERMLNDSVVNFSIQTICDLVGDCFMLSSHSPLCGCPVLPTTKISGFKTVVMPVHLSGIHWGVIIADMTFSEEGSSIAAHYYESLVQGGYRITMETCG